MSDDIVVVDNGQTYETQETSIVAKEEADRAEKWAKFAEKKANLASGQAIEAAEASDAAAQAATVAVENSNYVKGLLGNDGFRAVAADMIAEPSSIKTALENANNAAADAENAEESATIASQQAQDAQHWAEDSRVWATGEDAEVEEIAPGEEEHSSRGYAELAMAIANSPEDVPVDASGYSALHWAKKAERFADKVTGSVTAIEGRIGDIGFSAFGIDESLNTRRYLNGQVISQDKFKSFAEKIKEAIKLYPNIATSETNWQAEVTNSKLGQCGKFVIDDTAGTIRLPKVVNINGLTDLSLMGSIKAESLPNIRGEFRGRNAWNGDGPVIQTGALYSKENLSIVNGSQESGTNTYSLNFDASRSSSTYQDGAPVQQEAVQYPYFIQVATGVEESVDVTREIELNNPFSLLDYKWSEYELSNASWLISNGAFHSGATYVAVYELLLKIYNGTETKDGVSVKLSTEEYTDTDFVLNTVDTTFRLPIKVKLASGSAVAGNGMTLGLTDGTNYAGLQRTAVSTTSGVISPSTAYGSTNLGSKGGSSAVLENEQIIGITTDPEKSGIETSSSGLKLYFYVGETIQDANVIAAGGFLSALSNKVGFEDRETVVAWGLPDYSTAISLNGMDSYTATYPCWLLGAPNAPSGKVQYVYVNGIIITKEAEDYSSIQIPLDVGDMVTVSASNLNNCVICAMKGIK
nr:MAG TPA: hypothetical protein [Caudoviricetes sp.]